jgi:tetratricopeptide (TPR) repeat protein
MFYFGQTKSDRYTPYARNESHLADSIFSLVQSGFYDEAASLGSDYLKMNPSEISIYYHTGDAYLKAGNTEKAEEYLYKYQGLITSIIATGDGKSAESAYLVISPSDEFTITQFFGYSVSQQLLQDQNGHYFDILTALNKAGEEKEIYFNIDKPFGSLSKRLR